MNWVALGMWLACVLAAMAENTPFSVFFGVSALLASNASAEHVLVSRLDVIMNLLNAIHQQGKPPSVFDDE